MSDTPAFRIVVIDDDRTVRDSLEQLISTRGWEIKVLDRAERLDAMREEFEPDVILSDVRMPGIDGLSLLRSLAGTDAPPVVLISAHGDIPMAVEAMSAGAYSFLEKPFDPRRLLKLLENAAERRRLIKASDRLRSRLADLSGINRVLLGETEPVNALRKRVLELGDADVSVLLQGETGTGKEVVARAMHDLGNRASAPFVAVNCAAIPSGGFERFMFGEEGGLRGAFMRAGGGTLFLDEIAACPVDQQPGLLRALETREILPVGAERPVHVDLRIISATNIRLQEAVDAGEFRTDLYFRINTVILDLPTLRERREDIPLLYDRFLGEFATLYETDAPDVTTDDISALLAHHWPGNVRELRHVAERRILEARYGRGSVAQALTGSPPSADFPETLREATATFERQLISKALITHAGRMEDTADALGIGRRTLNEKIVKLGLDKSRLI